MEGVSNDFTAPNFEQPRTVQSSVLIPIYNKNQKPAKYLVVTRPAKFQNANLTQIIVEPR